MEFGKSFRGCTFPTELRRGSKWVPKDPAFMATMIDKCLRDCLNKPDELIKCSFAEATLSEYTLKSEGSKLKLEASIVFKDDEG